MDFHVPFFKYPELDEYSDVEGWEVVDPIRSIRTGDILLFSGSGAISTFIKFFTGTKWNHVGMATWIKIYLTNGREIIDLYCLELGSDYYTDLMTRKKVDGKVRLVRLANIAVMYDMISIRRLKFTRPVNFAAKFQEFALRHKGRKFPDATELMQSYMISAKKPNKRVTCAQLTALMLDEMGVYPLKFNPTQIAPSDFDTSSKAYPDSVFMGPSTILYRDDKKATIRVRYVVIVLVVVVVLMLIKLRKHYR